VREAPYRSTLSTLAKVPDSSGLPPGRPTSHHALQSGRDTCDKRLFSRSRAGVARYADGAELPEKFCYSTRVSGSAGGDIHLPINIEGTSMFPVTSQGCPPAGLIPPCHFSTDNRPTLGPCRCRIRRWCRSLRSSEFALRLMIDASPSEYLNRSRLFRRLKRGPHGQRSSTRRVLSKSARCAPAQKSNRTVSISSSSLFASERERLPSKGSLSCDIHFESPLCWRCQPFLLRRRPVRCHRFGRRRVGPTCNRS
jgi:hypothetical protein